MTAAAGQSASSEVHDRALAGVLAVGVRSLALQVLGFGASLVLARLLVPSELGSVAVGLTVVALASKVSEAGLGALLIRRSEPPTESDLALLAGTQLIASIVLTACVTALCLPFGHVGALTTAMALSMPLILLRTPWMVWLEWNLNYAPVARIEVIEGVVLHATTIIGLLAGMGVWAFPVAHAARALTVIGALPRITGLGWVRPRLSWREAKPMILFGLKFQAPDLIVAARDQGLNLAIASFGGLTLLGLWSLAARVLAAPVVLLSVLWRVSFPAMARLATAGHDGRLEMERGAGLAAYAAALLLVPIAGSAPLLIDTVFGHRWHEAAGVLPVICFGLQIEGPLSVCSFGFLSAAGAAGAVARIGIGAAAASLVTAIPLIPPLGLLGIGIGYVVGSVVGVILMWRAVRRRLDVRLAGAIARPTLAGTVVSGGAWLVARRLDADLPTLLLLVMTSLAALVILMRLLAAQTARDARVAVRRAIAQARSGARVSNGHTAAP